MTSTRTPTANYNLVLEQLRVRHLEKITKDIPASAFKILRLVSDPNDGKRAEQQNGTCVAENLATWFKLKKRGAKLMQGELRSRLNEWAEADECRGMPIYHVWVELGEMVYDTSNGKKELMNKDIYYLAHRVRTSEELPVVIEEKRINAKETRVRMFPDKEFQMPLYNRIREKQRQLGRKVFFD